MKKILTFLFACLLTGTVCGVNVFAETPVANQSGDSYTTTGTWTVTSTTDSEGSYTNQQFNTENNTCASQTDINVAATVTKAAASITAPKVYYVQIQWELPTLAVTQNADTATYTWDPTQTKYTVDANQVITLSEEQSVQTATITLTNHSNDKVGYAIACEDSNKFTVDHYDSSTPTTARTDYNISSGTLLSASGDKNTTDSVESKVWEGVTDPDQLKGATTTSGAINDYIKITGFNAENGYYGTLSEAKKQVNASATTSENQVVTTYTVTLTKVASN